MKAKEFHENLENKKDFTKLTKTGISSDYENVFDFAESYAKEQSNELKDKLLLKLEKLSVLQNIILEENSKTAICKKWGKWLKEKKKEEKKTPM